ncbi:hypothetical protein BpHYR1_028700 [Brachionus plicatilis]|uniref:Uncharacterized protein n=1 Tax=Brachionus plicatilis TaxID=10195 RepID=A0A3M7PE60_BRAPC|nr:hypothetical protein BpHYR1_028700 [Brachionus plicatilis]
MSNNGPKSILWLPADENKFGHATIQTNSYHMSFWPDGDVKLDYGLLRTFTFGIPGSIVFHHDRDYSLENKREPIVIELTNFSNRRLNETYEQLLHYNDITPDRVTIERGDDLVMRKIPPEISLKRSLYSLRGKFFYSEDFYKSMQSCTTFCLGLLFNSNEGGGSLVSSIFNRISSYAFNDPDIRQKNNWIFDDKNLIQKHSVVLNSKKFQEGPIFKKQEYLKNSKLKGDWWGVDKFKSCCFFKKLDVLILDIISPKGYASYFFNLYNIPIESSN